jgi:hypothetical protein
MGAWARQVALATCMGSGDDSVVSLRGGMDDAFSEEVQAGAAVHLPSVHLDLAVIAFGDAGVVAQGEAGGEVLADPVAKVCRSGRSSLSMASSQLARSLLPVRLVIILAKARMCPAMRSSWAQ